MPWATSTSLAAKKAEYAARDQAQVQKNKQAANTGTGGVLTNESLGAGSATIPTAGLAGSGAAVPAAGAGTSMSSGSALPTAIGNANPMPSADYKPPSNPLTPTTQEQAPYIGDNTARLEELARDKRTDTEKSLDESRSTWSKFYDDILGKHEQTWGDIEKSNQNQLASNRRRAISQNALMGGQMGGNFLAGQRQAELSSMEQLSDLKAKHGNQALQYLQQQIAGNMMLDREGRGYSFEKEMADRRLQEMAAMQDKPLTAAELASLEDKIKAGTATPYEQSLFERAQGTISHAFSGAANVLGGQGNIVSEGLTPLLDYFEDNK